MKKSILTLVVAMLSLTSFAQQGGGQRREFNPEEMANRRVEQIKQACKTTDEQNAKLQELFLKQSKEMQERMQAMRESGERPQFDREAMQKQREEQKAAVKAILTEEQFAAYEKLEQERGPRQGGGRGFGGGPRGQRLERPQNNQ